MGGAGMGLGNDGAMAEFDDPRTGTLAARMMVSWRSRGQIDEK